MLTDHRQSHGPTRDFPSRRTFLQAAGGACGAFWAGLSRVAAAQPREMAKRGQSS